MREAACHVPMANEADPPTLPFYYFHANQVAPDVFETHHEMPAPAGAPANGTRRHVPHAAAAPTKLQNDQVIKVAKKNKKIPIFLGITWNKDYDGLQDYQATKDFMKHMDSCAGNEKVDENVVLEAFLATRQSSYAFFFKHSNAKLWTQAEDGDPIVAQRIKQHIKRTKQKLNKEDSAASAHSEEQAQPQKPQACPNPEGNKRQAITPVRGVGSVTPDPPISPFTKRMTKLHQDFGSIRIDIEKADCITEFDSLHGVLDGFITAFYEAQCKHGTDFEQRWKFCVRWAVACSRSKPWAADYEYYRKTVLLLLEYLFRRLEQGILSRDDVFERFGTTKIARILYIFLPVDKANAFFKMRQDNDDPNSPIGLSWYHKFHSRDELEGIVRNRSGKGALNWRYKELFDRANKYLAEKRAEFPLKYLRIGEDWEHLFDPENPPAEGEYDV